MGSVSMKVDTVILAKPLDMQNTEMETGNQKIGRNKFLKIII